MKKFAKNISIYLVIFALVLTAAFFYKGGGTAEYKQVKFSTLSNYLESGRVTEIEIEDRKITAQIGKDKYVYTFAANITDIDWIEDTYIFPQVQEKKLEYKGGPKPSSGSVILNLLPTLIMVVALGFLFYLMMNQGGNGKAFSFGKSKARLYKGDGRQITFNDVAGLDEEKEELEEVVDFLKDPKAEPEFLKAFCLWVLREPVKPMSPKRQQGKPVFRFSPSVVPTL